jgi:hypothetical protein
MANRHWWPDFCPRNSHQVPNAAILPQLIMPLAAIYSQALEVYQAALQLCPDSKELAAKIKGLTKDIRRQQQQANKKDTAPEPKASQQSRSQVGRTVP